MIPASNHTNQTYESKLKDKIIQGIVMLLKEIHLYSTLFIHYS